MPYKISDLCVCSCNCAKVCPTGAITFNGDKYEIDALKCSECGRCRDYCNISAISKIGQVPKLATPHEPRELSCDLVVIGGGGSGLVAAVRAAEFFKRESCGDKSVIVLEKAKKPGGCSWYPGGFVSSGSQWEKNAGFPDNHEDNIRQAMEFTQWMLDPHLVKNTYDSLGGFFDWFNAHKGGGLSLKPCDSPLGIKFAAYNDTGSDKTVGQFVVEEMLGHCEKQGIHVLTEHEAIDLTTENGRVVSVSAKDPGGITTIRCDACVISTGSYVNDMELLKKYMPEFAVASKYRSAHILPQLTGDGIRLGEKAGAYIDYDNLVGRHFGPCAPFYSKLMPLSTQNSSIFVNKNGRRWISETVPTYDAGPALLQQPEAVSYTVFDKNVLECGELSSENIPPQFRIDGETMMQCLDELRRLAEKPDAVVYIAESIELLAEMTGINPNRLVETISQYNSFCAPGKDSEYFKPTGFLVPISNPPYYAIKCKLGTDGVFGGIKVNGDMQAYSSGGGLVEGLYVTGDTASGRFLDFATARTKLQIVMDFSWALASGFMAGDNVARYITKLSKGKEI